MAHHLSCKGYAICKLYKTIKKNLGIFNFKQVVLIADENCAINQININICFKMISQMFNLISASMLGLIRNRL